MAKQLTQVVSNLYKSSEIGIIVPNTAQREFIKMKPIPACFTVLTGSLKQRILTTKNISIESMTT
jgi:hypothetical protein